MVPGRTCRGVGENDIFRMYTVVCVVVMVGVGLIVPHVGVLVTVITEVWTVVGTIVAGVGAVVATVVGTGVWVAAGVELPDCVQPTVKRTAARTRKTAMNALFCIR